MLFSFIFLTINLAFFFCFSCICVVRRIAFCSIYLFFIFLLLWRSCGVACQSSRRHSNSLCFPVAEGFFLISFRTCFCLCFYRLKRANMDSCVLFVCLFVCLLSAIVRCVHSSSYGSYLHSELNLLRGKKTSSCVQ
ncbi:hypothetical protein ABB37_05329 [Leptomonas pyrrhocoris]|uniref:Uncharacterized protein n=1 Tax=Leptomonas pyrrhocoris TaxID=157538 RepID=A0A0M9G036_LEPPY|nr:hypothetical protein ABB37_05329 [Leptomonas pyrrhocoris]KPA79503.1 hypothetical protein ABB37_05329 [Leptomonas pyrrhocoris]|eukprot:XP_015657942.1 hypothetical protein ABB37_05329 [Leptomonas pyrrhocoris]